MKLFLPVLHWGITDSAHNVTLKIKDSEEFTLSLSFQMGEVEPVVALLPPMSEDTDPPPQIEFLSAVYAALGVPLVAWVVSKHPEGKLAALGAMLHTMDLTVRTIEQMPRSAEASLEVHRLAMMSEVSTTLAQLLFGEEVCRHLITPASELEKQLIEKYKLAPETFTGSKVEADLQPASYQCVFPPAPQEASDALQRLRQERARREEAWLAAHALASMPVGGSA